MKRKGKREREKEKEKEKEEAARERRTDGQYGAACGGGEGKLVWL